MNNLSITLLKGISEKALAIECAILLCKHINSYYFMKANSIGALCIKMYNGCIMLWWLYHIGIYIPQWFNEISMICIPVPNFVHEKLYVFSGNIQADWKYQCVWFLLKMYWYSFSFIYLFAIKLFAQVSHVSRYHLYVLGRLDQFLG